MSDEDIFWDDGTPPVPPLQKGSKLFINDDERADFDKANEIAYLGIKREHFFDYAIQYKRAADRLIQTINSLLDRETCVLPIMFLYRHYIELQLKSILEDEGNENPNIYQLNALWKQVKPILERILKQLSRNELLAEMEAAEERIMEFYC